MSELLFIPLGGTGEIGMNFNVYGKEGKWLIIDCGTGFAEDIPGVTMIVPNIDFIKENKEDIVGMVITHAHEDHLGAVQHLWKEIGCPIYTTNFTANFLRARLRDCRISDIQINEVEEGNLFVDPFDLELIPMTHSIPEMHSVAIKTENGIVFHSGDWKLDDDPVVGKKSNEERLIELGKEGVLSIICDSTNVFSEGHSGSEGELYENIKEVVNEAEKLIAFSLFASNIARIHTIAKIAKETGRSVVVLGRSLDRSISAAIQSGYLEEFTFLNPNEAVNLEREKTLLLCTGCQGDVLAATNRLSLGTHSVFQLEKGDTVVFSSRIIPGNERKIFASLNRFISMGVNIVTERSKKIHVSGHPYRDELKKMYEMLKPKTVIPVHGEPMHIQEHARLAQSCGIEQLEIKNGDVIQFSSSGAKKIDSIETGFLCLDGRFLCDPLSRHIRERRRMQDSGMILIVLLVDRRHNELIKRPSVMSPGFNSDHKLLDRISRVSEEVMFNNFGANKKINTLIAIRLLRKEVIRCLTYTGKKPLIEIKIEFV